MGTFDQLRSTLVHDIVAELAAADRGGEANLGDFDITQDAAGHFIGNSPTLRLSSVFQPVFGAGASEVLGHTAYIRTDQLKGGNTHANIFATIESNAALVHLDRLCRALHLLNYFHRALPGWQLWLRVESRLLVTVKQHHGAVFRRILERYCGLSTSRVVIELPIEAAQEAAVLAVALANYRTQGYRTAINYHTQIATDVLKFADFVHIEATLDQPMLKQMVSRVHSGGGTAIVKKVESEPLRAAAVDAGADGLQGFLLGRPAFELTSLGSSYGQLRGVEAARIKRAITVSPVND